MLTLIRVIKSDILDCGHTVHDDTNMCKTSEKEVLLINFNIYKCYVFRICNCQNLCIAVIHHGFFPTSSKTSKLAFSLNIMSLFHEIFMMGPISKMGFAQGLRSYLQ